MLSRPRLRIREGLRQQLMTLITRQAHSIEPGRRLQVTSDPDDDKFVECADAARADYLLTGNQRHFPEFCKRTKIITARQFINVVSPHLIP